MIDTVNFLPSNKFLQWQITYENSKPVEQAEHLFSYARTKWLKALHFKAISITRVIRPKLFENYFKWSISLKLAIVHRVQLSGNKFWGQILGPLVLTSIKVISSLNLEIFCHWDQQIGLIIFLNIFPKVFYSFTSASNIWQIFIEYCESGTVENRYWAWQWILYGLWLLLEKLHTENDKLIKKGSQVLQKC